MKVRTLLITLGFACATSGFAASIIYDFQGVLAGPMPGGFLSLTVGGVNAFFAGFDTAVDINPVTGTHVLHTGNYHSGISMELSMPVSQIIIGIDSSIPTQNNSVQAIDYYGPGYTVYPMPAISSSGSTLVFNVPHNYPDDLGIVLDGTSGDGYSLDYVSIQLVPEPAPTSMLLVFGAATVVVLRVRRRTMETEPATTLA